MGNADACHFPMTGVCHMPVHLSGLVSKYYAFASRIGCEPRIFIEKHNKAGSLTTAHRSGNTDASYNAAG